MMIKNIIARIVLIIVFTGQLSEGIVLAETNDERLFLRRPWDQTSGQIPFSFRRDIDERSKQPALGRPGGIAMPNLDQSGGEGYRAVSYQVHVVGEVNQPGTYRILPSQRMQEAMQLAGGPTLQGSHRSIQIRRHGTSTKNYDLLRFQLFGELQHNPYLMDNDVVFVPLRKTAIQVVGSVKRPNVYELTNEGSLKDAIALAGGFTVGAADNAPLRLIRFVNGKKTIFEIEKDPDKMQAAPIQNGDVIYVPTVLAANRKFDYNIAKMPGDQVFYPSYEDRVFVLGGVNNPGPYPFNPYGTVSQYLTLAGGTTKLARVNHVKLIAMEGERRKIRKNDDSVTINPGDTIFVPEPRLPPEAWVSIVTGLMGFGLSATATTLSLTR